MARLDESRRGRRGTGGIINFVYVLVSGKDRRSYVGSTVDLVNRLKEHNAGKCVATKNRRPLKLVYSEPYDNIADARKREKFPKTPAGRRKLKEIFKNIHP